MAATAGALPIVTCVISATLSILKIIQKVLSLTHGKMMSGLMEKIVLKHLKQFLVISSALAFGMFILNVFGATMATFAMWDIRPLEVLFGSWAIIRWSLVFGLSMGTVITAAMAFDEGGE
jgi:hypothetical protein